MAPVPSVGRAFFPLDEELGLLGGGLTPRGEETLVRLASWMPYGPAQQLLRDVLGIQVSKATARRATLAAGRAGLAVDEQEEARLKQEMPAAASGADQQLMSADGAFVPLVGGEWAEVKTLVIGEVTRNQQGDVCTQHLSAFSRLTSAPRFEEAALVETHRRGLEQARTVCAVQDGAEWLPALVDYHRVDAVRILDFAHAGEYVNEIGQAVRGAGGRLPVLWLSGVLHRLKHEGPSRVLAHVAWLAARYPGAMLQEKVTYLQKREANMQYPTYQAAGWPIGSGSVESANKVVVEARLKGAGMHWERHNVNPMLVLRNAVCNERWEESWNASWAYRRTGRTMRHQQRSQQRLTAACWMVAAVSVRLHRLSAPPPPAVSAVAKTSKPSIRPASGYSWRKPFLRRLPPNLGAKK